MPDTTDLGYPYPASDDIPNGPGAFQDLAQAVDMNSPRMVNVRMFGAVGDGSTDDTAAITDAVDAVAAGGTVFFPGQNSRYKIVGGIPALTKAVTFLGETSPRTTTADPFGDANWNTNNESGTFLVTADTTGQVIDTGGFPFSMRTLGIKGLGADTRTTIGVLLNGAGLGTFDDVIVLNFETGWKVDGSQLNHFTACRSRGNGTGWRVDADANANKWALIDSSADGIGICATSSVGLTVHGGGIQGYVTTGILLAGGVEESRFAHVYLESTTGEAIALDDSIAAGDGNDDNVFDRCHEGGAGSDVRVDNGNGNVFYLSKAQGDHSFAAGTQDNRLIGRWLMSNYEDLGDNVFEWIGDGGTGYYFPAAPSLHPGIVLEGASRVFLDQKTDGGMDISFHHRDDVGGGRLHDNTNNASFIRWAPDAGGPKVAFFNTAPIAKPTGVPVTAAGVHQALKDLGLIDGP